MGIDIQRVYLISFVLGAALAGVAGCLLSIGYSIDPMMGLNWTLKGLIVMVLGGLGSIMGTFVGGILLGVTESLTGFFLSLTYREVVGLVLFPADFDFPGRRVYSVQKRSESVSRKRPSSLLCSS